MTIYLVYRANDFAAGWVIDVDKIYSTIEKASDYLKEELLWHKKRPKDWHSRGVVNDDGYLTKVFITATDRSGGRLMYWIEPRKIE